MWRVRWHSRQEGSETPADRWLDEAEATISEGVREMACRVNQDSASFAKTAANLARAAHWSISKEALRQLIEGEGEVVVDAIGLDFYHLRENVQKSRRIVFGEESAEGKTWLEGVMHTFRHVGSDSAWDQLV